MRTGNVHWLRVARVKDGSSSFVVMDVAAKDKYKEIEVEHLEKVKFWYRVYMVMKLIRRRLVVPVCRV